MTFYLVSFYGLSMSLISIMMVVVIINEDFLFLFFLFFFYFWLKNKNGIWTYFMLYLYFLGKGYVFGVFLIMIVKVFILKVVDRGIGVECDMLVENSDGVLKF